MSLNLEKQLQFYGAYHHNAVNIGIHIACVPVLLFTGLLLATNTPNLLPIPQDYIVPYLPPNLALIACSAYCVLYVLLEPVAGGAFSVLLLAGTAAGNYLTTTYGATANYWAAGIHAASWIAQFIGHGVFEGRAPALMDNLFQAIFLAPLFVWLEMLFAFGYRPELKDRVSQLVQQDVKKFRDSKQTELNGKANGSANGHAKSS